MKSLSEWRKSEHFEGFITWAEENCTEKTFPFESALTNFSLFYRAKFKLPDGFNISDEKSLQMQWNNGDDTLFVETSLGGDFIWSFVNVETEDMKFGRFERFVDLLSGLPSSALHCGIPADELNDKTALNIYDDSYHENVE